MIDRIRVSLNTESTNTKTGPIPVSTTSANSCPKTCPFRDNGCYASEGPLRFHWQKVSGHERGMTWGEFCHMVSLLPDGQLWRHNQAGDLPGDRSLDIDYIPLMKLIKANKGKRGYTYTHRTRGEFNRALIRYANSDGFTINLSADGLAHADELFSLGVGPVVAVVPSWEHRAMFRTPAGNRVKMCPAILGEIKCKDCQRCYVEPGKKRDYIIAVPAHGSGVVKVDKVVAGIKSLF